MTKEDPEFGMMGKLRPGGRSAGGGATFQKGREGRDSRSGREVGNLGLMLGGFEVAVVLEIFKGSILAMAFVIGDRKFGGLERGVGGGFALRGFSKQEVPLAAAGGKDKPDDDQERAEPAKKAGSRSCSDPGEGGGHEVEPRSLRLA